MATVYPTSAGTWSTRTWNNDATGLAYGMAPQPGDIVLANGVSTTLDIDITVASIRTSAGTTAIAGGNFTTIASATRTLNCDILAGTTACLSISTASNTITINGNVIGGSVVSAHGVSCGQTTGSFTINGNCTGGAANASGVSCNPSCTITGNCTGGGVSGAVGALLTGNNTYVVNGNAAGGTVSLTYGVNITGSSGTLTFTGNVTGGTGGATPAGVTVTAGTANITVTGYTQPTTGSCFRLLGGASTVTFTGGTFTTTSSANIFVITAGSHTIICSAIQGSATGGIVISSTAAGFVRIQADILGNAGTNVTVISTNASLYVIGNITGGNTAFDAIAFSGSLTVIGNVTGGSVSAANGIRGGSSSGNKAHAANIKGIVTGGSHSGAQGISNQGPMDIYIYGSTVNSTGNATTNTGGGTVTVVSTGGGGGGVKSYSFGVEA